MLISNIWIKQISWNNSLTVMTTALQSKQKYFTSRVWILVRISVAFVFFRLQIEHQFKVKIEEIGDQPLRDMIKDLGGWPVLYHSWDSPGWRLETLLGKLRGDYNQGLIVEQWVGPDDRNSSIHIIQVSFNWMSIISIFSQIFQEFIN